MREGMREASALHSRERRFVSESLRALLRWERVLAFEADGDASFEARWAAWLRWCDPATRAEARGRAEAHLAGLAPVDALAWVGSLDAATAEALWARWGEGAFAFLAASNRGAPVVLRANLLRASREAVVARLAAEGVAAAPTAHSPWGLVVDTRAPLTGLASYREGWFEVQDEGSQLLVALAAAGARGPVVDFCAGAGGKSLALAAAGLDSVWAADIRPAPLEELGRRARRAGAEVRASRLRETGPLPAELEALRGRADRVLVDAPCTGSGVLRRHPEHRWRLTQAAELGRLQGQILSRAAPLVAPGGRLVYGTCSVLPAEDEAVVERFLAENHVFRRVPASEVLPELPGAGDHLLVAPHTHGTDGFFGAVLERV